MKGNIKTVTVNINELNPSKYNPRVELTPADEEYNQLKKSIETFGYSEPIIVNKDYTVIGGHQRLNVLKDLGYETVDVVILNLTKSKEKALNIALNKISGRFDDDKLKDLLFELRDEDFDLEAVGFDELEVDSLLDLDLDIEEEETENARMNTINGYNLQLYDSRSVDGYYQMPIIKNNKTIPKDLIGFNYVLSDKNPEGKSIHFFLDDYQFERLWNTPEQYVEKLMQYEVVLSPDFSLYMNMPMAMKIWNVYRSRLLGHYWQTQGIKVIPTISWAERDTFDFCFDGIPLGSIVAVSTIGVKKEDEAFSVWKNGMDAMIKKIKPKTIIVYGGKVEYDYGNIQVIYFDNKVTERMKDDGKTKNV